jgi:hypothetical protein
MFVADLFQQDKLIVEWTPSSDRIPDQIWKELFPPPFEGGWWYETMENSDLQDQFKFLYAVVKRKKKVVAVAPAFLMDVPISLVMPDEILAIANAVTKVFPNLAHQRTLFLGSPCADEGRVGIIAGEDELPILFALQGAAEIKAKQEQAHMLVWKDFPDAYKSSFSRVCRSKKLFSMPSFPGTVVELLDGKIETYFDNLKRTRRYNLKRKLRKSRAAGNLAVSVIQNPDDEDIEAIFGLFLQTYKKGKTKFEKLNIKFFRLIAAQPCAHFVILREEASQDPVAFMLCFNLGEKIINKFIGIDYTRPTEYFLYFRLWEAALEWVLQQGAKEFQSGQTGYRAKIDIGNQLVPLTNYCKHFNPLLHMAYEQGARLVSWSTLDEDLKGHLESHPENEPQDPTEGKDAKQAGAPKGSKEGKHAKTRSTVGEAKVAKDLNDPKEDAASSSLTGAAEGKSGTERCSQTQSDQLSKHKLADNALCDFLA